MTTEYETFVALLVWLVLHVYFHLMSGLCYTICLSMASHPHTQELTKTLHSANLVLVSVQFVTFRTLRTGLFQVVTEVLAAVIFSKCF